MDNSTANNEQYSSQKTPPAPAPSKRHWSKKRWLFLIAAIVVVIAAITVSAVLLLHKAAPKTTAASSQSSTTHPVSTSPTTSSTTVPGLQLDTSKDYGNVYANNLLPVGDGKYSTTTAKQGYIYTCSTYAQSLSSGQGGGASVRGPWFTNNNTEYDLSKKVHVQGDATWASSFSDVVNGATRTITTNDLPVHSTGVFPISSSDPAYMYDRNPNSITAQDLTYSLPVAPTYSTTPHCMGGEAGVMLTGIALFNGFDAEGRDAGAWEVQDGCDGHPEKDGEYHYHTLSSCIKDTSVSTVIGFALDGYPITGPKISANNILTTADLDECHGIVSPITLDGKTTTMYHYVMTQDFPYSVSCFRAQPTTLNPTAGSQSGGSASAPTRQSPPPRQL